MSHLFYYANLSSHVIYPICLHETSYATVCDYLRCFKKNQILGKHLQKVKSESYKTSQYNFFIHYENVKNMCKCVMHVFIYAFYFYKYHHDVYSKYNICIIL